MKAVLRVHTGTGRHVHGQHSAPCPTWSQQADRRWQQGAQVLANVPQYLRDIATAKRLGWLDGLEARPHKRLACLFGGSPLATSRESDVP